MAKKSIYNMTSGEWLTSDKTSGTGRATVQFTAPSWTGRETRLAVRIVKKDNAMKAISFKQLGVPVTEISVDRLDFPIGGGDKQILITTNSATLAAKITSDLAPSGTIKSFTTASGLDITVNDTSLNYGFPGDPGLESTFQVSIIVSMPDNSMGEEKNENITINGVLIPIYQPGRVIPYIKFEKDFEQIEGTDSSVSIGIESNVEKYRIEIVECYEEEQEDSIELSSNVITLEPTGDPKSLSVTTTPKNLAWRVTNG